MDALFAANPRNLKLPATGPGLLPVGASSAQNPKPASPGRERYRCYQRLIGSCQSRRN
jgi:hypothetical protein